MRLKKVFFGIVASTAGALLFAGLPAVPVALEAPSSKAPAKTAVVFKTPIDAVDMVAADLSTIPLSQRPYHRYLFVLDASQEAMRASSLCLNFVSRGSVIMRPLPVQGGYLLRVDLRHYWPGEADLREAVKLWEEFGFDPTFNRLVTRDQVAFAQKAPAPVIVSPAYTKRVEFHHAGGPYKAPDDSGREYPDFKAGFYWIDLEFKAKTKPGEELHVDVLRVHSPALPGLLSLQLQTASVAPIVEWRYFLSRALSTVQDKGVFKTVWGGLYYQLRGIKKAKDVLGADTKATDLDVFFEQLGIGNTKAGLTAERLFDVLRSDQRLAVFRSGVTGKPREVSMFTTPAEREGAGWGAITGDIKDADVDIGDRAYANLLNPRRQAREAIFPTRNGFLLYALFNGQGALVDEVPPDVAMDATIPAPYTRRLQAAIGCIRCHGPNDAWQPLTNDVKKLMAGRLDIFGDLGARRAFDADTLDRLAGLYAGDFNKHLRRARDDSAEAMLRASGPWPDSRSQTDAAVRGSAAIAKAYGDYTYELVTPQTALRELGIDAQPSQAKALFAKSFPPDLRSPNYVGGVSEDVRIAALKEGIPILRTDFALTYSYLLERMKKGPIHEATLRLPGATRPPGTPVSQ